VPIILITALTDSDSRGRGTTAGADDFITKPFDPDRLMESMSRHRSRNGTPK
jgi:DNA-binding response OmpR family regulator